MEGAEKTNGDIDRDHTRSRFEGQQIVTMSAHQKAVSFRMMVIAGQHDQPSGVTTVNSCNPGHEWIRLRLAQRMATGHSLFLASPLRQALPGRRMGYGGIVGVEHSLDNPGRLEIAVVRT